MAGELTAYGESFALVQDGAIGLASVTATKGDVSVKTGHGELIVLAGGNVSANSGSVDVQALGGGISLSGDVSASGDVVLAAKGNVTGDGALSAGGDLDVNSAQGGVELAGVVRIDDLNVTAAGDVYVANAANVFRGVANARGRSVSVLADGLVLGDVTATDGSIKLVVADGDVRVAGGTTVSGQQVYLKSFGGNVSVDGSVLAEELVYLESAANGDLTVAGRVESAGTIQGIATEGSVVIDGTVCATGADGSIFLRAAYGKGAQGDLKVGSGGSVTAGSKGGCVELSAGLQASDVTAGRGDVVVQGTVAAGAKVRIHTADGSVRVSSGAVVAAKDEGGAVHIATGYAERSTGDITIEGSVSANGTVQVVSAEGAGSRGDVRVTGAVSAGERALVMAGYANDGEGAALASGDATVSGSVTAGKSAIVGTGNGLVTLSGSVAVLDSDGSAYLAGGIYNGSRGDIRVEGTLSSGGDAFVMTGVSGKTPGNVSFGVGGSVTAGGNAFVTTSAGGDVEQEGASVPSAVGGYVGKVLLPAAVSAKTVNLKVNGTIGHGENAPVVVDGKVFGYASGDASLAAANGGNLQGGENPGSLHTELGDFDWANMAASSVLEAGGSLCVYAPGGISPYGNFLAGKDLTVSASSFGDVSYLRAGGTLTINNVDKPSWPQVAYFESVNGVEPRLNNQPNDIVIFIDGRLAGGNLRILNQFGANEAFLVETPELKSTQGIFGNPTFLHSDLDVANPMEVNVVDYLLQETPRLTLDKDFPREVDQHVDSVVIPEKDSILFGQRRGGEEKPEEKAEEKVVTVPATDDKVALAK